MISLKLSVVVCWLAMVGLEAKPAPAMPVGTYSLTTQMGTNSIAQQPAETTRTTSRGRVVEGGPDDFRSYLPSVDTPEVQEAKERFFDAFKQQTDLINEVREDGLWSAQPYADYYEDFEDAGQGENEYEDEEEEGDGGEEQDEEDDDDDDDDEDSDEDSSSSSSSSSEEDSDEEDSDEEDDEDEDDEEDEDDDEEEDDDDEDEEDDDDEEDSDEDDEDSSSSSSSSEEDYGDDSSSSSSSSSSSEEDGDPAILSMQALQALQPQQVEDTPEVQAAKLKFFDAYKNQIELVSNDV